MTDLTPEGLRARAWQVMHEADSCDHSSCGVPHDNADRECEAQRIAAAFTTLVAEARLGSPLREYVVVQAHDKTGGKGVIVCRSELDVVKAVGAMLDVGFTEVRCTKDSAIRAQEETP